MHIIYCKTATLLSKRPYRDWREIQEHYPDYMASLGPWDIDEIIGFFRDEYGAESEWPFTRARMAEFLEGGEETLRGGGA